MLIGMYLSFAFFIGLPIVFFENTSAIEGIRKSFSLVHANFITVLVLWLLAGIIASAGFILLSWSSIYLSVFLYRKIFYLFGDLRSSLRSKILKFYKQFTESNRFHCCFFY